MDASKLTDEQLNQMVAQKIAAPVASKPELSDEELNRMVAEKLANEAPTRMDKDDEADLGFFNRLQYSLEPLESNRKAFLSQQFGPGNVKEDAEGNVYVRQGDVFKPVNEEGFSVADIADVAGSTPEILGAGAGALLGMGPGSIPGAIAGGAAGSAARQGLSALIGTPQVATPIERATEIGLSGAFGGAGAGLGKGLKAVGKKALPGLKKLLPKMQADEVGEEIAEFAKREGLPMPSSAQMAGGDALEREKAQAFKKFGGMGIRKRVDKQLKAIKESVEKDLGNFVNESTEAKAYGQNIKDRAFENLKRTKQVAGELFDSVAEEAGGVSIPKASAKKELLQNFSSKGFFDRRGNPLPYNANYGLSKKAFKRVQGVFKDILQGIDSSGRDVIESQAGVSNQGITAEALNNLRKTVDDNIQEFGRLKQDDRILVQLRNALLDTTENMLEAKDPRLKGEFAAARKLYKNYLDNNKILTKARGGLNLENLDDADVLEKVFSKEKNIDLLKQVTDEKTVKDAGRKYVNELLIKEAGGVDRVGYSKIKNTLEKRKFQIIRAIGRKDYNKLRDSIKYLERVGRPVNPSGSGKVMAFDFNPGNIIGSILSNAGYATGKTARRAVQHIPEVIEKIPRRAARGASAITDQTQRELGYLTRNPVLRTPQSEGGGNGNR